ncbi:MAG TPA: GNAT family N-acetyltransferase [Micromonospora sp.]
MTGAIDVRPATADDLDAILDVHVRARTAYYLAGGLPPSEIDNPADAAQRRAGWRAAIGSTEKVVRCAVVDGAVVGVVGMGPPLDPAEDATRVGQLYQIHVHPDHWGSGVGGALHGAFVAYLRESCRTTGLLEAWARNQRGRAFYARHGWRPDGSSVPGPGGADYLRLRLDLG